MRTESARGRGSHFLSPRLGVRWRRGANDSVLEKPKPRGAARRGACARYSASAAPALACGNAQMRTTRARDFRKAAGSREKNEGLTRRGASPDPWFTEEEDDEANVIWLSRSICCRVATAKSAAGAKVHRLSRRFVFLIRTLQASPTIGIATPRRSRRISRPILNVAVALSCCTLPRPFACIGLTRRIQSRPFYPNDANGCGACGAKEEVACRIKSRTENLS